MSRERAELLNWDDMSMQEVLELAIADEEDARNYYRRAAELAGNPHTRQTLLQLAAMEQGHADALRDELQDLLAQRELEAGLAD